MYTSYIMGMGKKFSAVDLLKFFFQEHTKAVISAVSVLATVGYLATSGGKIAHLLHKEDVPPVTEEDMREAEAEVASARSIASVIATTVSAPDRIIRPGQLLNAGSYSSYSGSDQPPPVNSQAATQGSFPVAPSFGNTNRFPAGVNNDSGQGSQASQTLKSNTGTTASNFNDQTGMSEALGPLLTVAPPAQNINLSESSTSKPGVNFGKASAGFSISSGGGLVTGTGLEVQASVGEIVSTNYSVNSQFTLISGVAGILYSE